MRQSVTRHHTMKPPGSGAKDNQAPDRREAPPSIRAPIPIARRCAHVGVLPHKWTLVRARRAAWAKSRLAAGGRAVRGERIHPVLIQPAVKMAKPPRRPLTRPADASFQCSTQKAVAAHDETAPCCDEKPHAVWNRAASRAGTAEREAAAAFSQRLPKGATLGADKGYDAEAFVESLKARGIEPHIAINGTVSKHGKARKTAVPSEVAASVRYAISQRLRKRIEEGFGWTKTVGGLTQVKVRGLAKVRAAFVLAMAAYNIVRLPKLLAPRGEARPAT